MSTDWATCQWLWRLFCCFDLDLDDDPKALRRRRHLQNQRRRSSKSSNFVKQEKKEKGRPITAEELHQFLRCHTPGHFWVHPQYFPTRSGLAARRRREARAGSIFADTLSDLTERTEESLAGSFDLDLERSSKSAKAIAEEKLSTLSFEQICESKSTSDCDNQSFNNNYSNNKQERLSLEVKFNQTRKCLLEGN